MHDIATLSRGTSDKTGHCADRDGGKAECTEGRTKVGDSCIHFASATPPERKCRRSKGSVPLGEFRPRTWGGPQ